jgi:hypothetical protein
MYEAREHWIAYQKEKKLKHKHEVIASLSALSVIAAIALVAFCLV